MSDAALRDLVLRRLDVDTQPEDEWSALVLAAVGDALVAMAVPVGGPR
jgi:hypothetical protein